MPDKLVVQLATEIASQTIQNNILFYVIVALLSVVASAVTAYLGAYWKKRGEAYAASADFKEVLEQLKKQLKQQKPSNLNCRHSFLMMLRRKRFFEKNWKSLLRQLMN